MDTKDRTALRNFVKSGMKRFGVPGCAVGILQDGVETTVGAGVTNVEFPLPVDGETLFQIGSTTKTFTGTALMQLVEAGKLSLSDPVTKFLPGLKLSSPEIAPKVTVQHLVTHTGGWLGDYFSNFGRGNDALRRMVTRLRKVPQLTPVGTVWSYNNSGFYIAGRIIEVLTGKPYEQAVTESIFQPLEMTKSFFFPEEVFTHKTALGHSKTKDGIKIARPWGMSRSGNPAGAIVSTAADQLKWARFHLGQGGTKVLSKAARRRMQQPLAKAGSMAEEVGVTWLLDRIGNSKIVKHGGTINGQLSAFALVPSMNFGITVLTNSTAGGQLHGAVTTWAFERLCGLKRPEPQPMKLSAKALTDYMGRFKTPGGEFVVRSNGSGLVGEMELSQKQRKNPEAIAAVPPPMNLIVSQKDRIIVMDGASKGSRLDIVRNEDGSVGWIRFGGRIYSRLGDV